LNFIVILRILKYIRINCFILRVVEILTPCAVGLGGKVFKMDRDRPNAKGNHRGCSRADSGQIRGVQGDDNGQQSAVHKQGISEISGGAGGVPLAHGSIYPAKKRNGKIIIQAIGFQSEQSFFFAS